MCDEEKGLLDYINESVDKSISKTQNIDDTIDAIVSYLLKLYEEEDTETCRTIIDAFFVVINEKYCMEPKVTANLALKLINGLDSVDREKMLEVSESYLEYIKKAFGKRSLQYAFVLYIIGVLVRFFRQDSERAFDCLEKSFDIRLKALGRKHRLTNYSLKEIGKLYESSFKLNRALWAYTTIIKNCDSNTLEEKSVIYWAMVHASNVYCIKSEYEKALEMLSRVLSDMTMQSSGEFENLFAEAYHILALVKLDSGMFIEAEKNVIEALDRCDEKMIEAKLRYNSTYIQSSF